MINTMKNTMLTAVQPSMTLLAITGDQANTLIDLVNDQIRAQRVYLRATPLKVTHITALTHFRNLKRLLLEDERKRMRQTAEEDENTELYSYFTGKHN